MDNRRNTRQIRVSKEVHQVLKDFSYRHGYTICDFATTILAHYYLGDFEFKKGTMVVPTNLKSDPIIEY